MIRHGVPPTESYRKSTNSWANLATLMLWHNVHCISTIKRQYLQLEYSRMNAVFTVVDTRQSACLHLHHQQQQGLSSDSSSDGIVAAATSSSEPVASEHHQPKR
jgi:hypothetical protein